MAGKGRYSLSGLIYRKEEKSVIKGKLGLGFGKLILKSNYRCSVHHCIIYSNGILRVIAGLSK